MTNNTNGIARHWRLKSQRYNLTGQTCKDCNTVSFPPRGVCPVCSEASDQVLEFYASAKEEAAPTVVEFSLQLAGKQLEPLAA